MNFETCSTSVNAVWTKVLFLLLALLLISCDGDNDSKNADEVNPYAGYESEQYDGPENWLCRPDIQGEDNACEGDLSSTIVFADGTTQYEGSVPTEEQPVDCFHLYGTTSLDEGGNSDLVPGRETEAVFVKMARYRAVCNIYTPLYRSITLPALIEGKYGDIGLNDVAYGDVVDAFKYLVANADGRGFILVGHSQGSTHLIRLIQEEIESHPYLARRMISAHLVGWTVELPLDSEVGATFASTPPCTFENEINCFVNYTSFRKSVPPAEETQLLPIIFGNTLKEDTRVACTNPVDLGGGLLNLDSYFRVFHLEPYADSERNESITTLFVKLPGLVQGECIEQDGKGYLAITVDADPSDPRVDDVGNDGLPGWGLHRLDIQLAHGDLVRLADRQADKWLNR